MSTDLVLLVPVLARPHRVAPLLESIETATPDARVVFICDASDPLEHRAIQQARLNCDLRVDSVILNGNYALKINHGVKNTTEPLIFTGADDLHFHPGWLEAARELLTGEVGVVGTNDLCSPRVIAGEHATHSLVARWYAELGTIDEPGKLLHEGYMHEWVDDELVATAKHRDAFAHAPNAVVEHLHPMAGKAPMDDLYAGQRIRMKVGRRLFHKRMALWM